MNIEERIKRLELDLESLRKQYKSATIVGKKDLIEKADRINRERFMLERVLKRRKVAPNV